MRSALAEADAVLPTLDAGDSALFRRINRPHRRLSFEQHVAGIEAFARMPGRGRLWIEVMLVAGLNDTDEALQRLAGVLARIGPDEIHLTLPSRCPVEPWVRPSDTAGIARAQAILGARATVAVPWPAEDDAPPMEERMGGDPDLVAVVTRHPLRPEEVARLFPGWPASRMAMHIDAMTRDGRLETIERLGQRFLVAAGSRFPGAIVPVGRGAR